MFLTPPAAPLTLWPEDSTATLDLALVGLPLSGKTTVFRALAAGHAAAGARSDHIAAVKVPDERLRRLAALVHAEKVTPAELRLHDLPSLFQKAAPLSGEAADSLARADALVHVVRAFHRDDVPHPLGSVDPLRDITALESEMLLHDLAILERRLDKLETGVRSARPGQREPAERELHLLQRAKHCLDDGLPLRDRLSQPDDLRALASYGLLTLKPALLLLNIDEADVARAAAIEDDYRDRRAAAPSASGPGPRTFVAALCGRLEAELAELSPEEAAEFRRELGAGDSAVHRVLRLAQELLGLVTFYTTVGDECRAWPVPSGTTALQAAGRIHSDMERGFIRAEVIGWEKLLEAGSPAEARKHGLLRTEGKQYVVQDGDVLHVLFHV